MEPNPCREMVLYRPNDANKLYKTPKVPAPRDLMASQIPFRGSYNSKRVWPEPHQLPRWHMFSHTEHLHSEAAILVVLQYDIACHFRRNARAYSGEAVEATWVLLAPPTGREVQAGKRRNDVPFVRSKL
ncbi:hypothetical protein B0H14DRAFT_2593653 [Mycena olivaceomarginata]|nr:hypothetical protein B0H14DRAFT_2593653 [Mycena olivaceomarginata]